MKVLPVAVAILLTSAARGQDHIHDANELYEQLVFLRGLELRKLPKKEKPSVAQLRDELARAFCRDDGVRDYMLQTMGFLPGKLTIRRKLPALLLKQGVCHYDHRSNTIWVHPTLERKYGDFMYRLALVKPLVHAIDEKYFAAGSALAAIEDNSDAAFARMAVYEGSAVAMMQQWAVRHREGRPINQLLAVRKFEDDRNRAAHELPPVFSHRLAASLLGMWFLTRGKGSAALLPHIPLGISHNARDAYKDPPKSSEQILHPDKYWLNRDEPVVLGDSPAFAKLLAERLGGARILLEDTLGEWHCGILCSGRRPMFTPQVLRNLVLKPRYWTRKASKGWGGDRVYVVERDGERGVVWFTWWDNSADVVEFETAYRTHYGKRVGFAARKFGRLIVFAYGACKPKLGELLQLAVKSAQPKKAEQTFPIEERPVGKPGR